MNILTFDIEDWFHIQFDRGFNEDKNLLKFESRIQHNVEKILGLLEQKNQKATFFCLGWVARNHPGVIRSIIKAGHQVGSHSNNHNLAFNLNEKEFSSDLTDSLSLLEDISGQKVIYYRAPAFSIKNENSWAFDILIENGIEIDCSIFPSSRDFGGFHKLSVSEPFKIERNGLFIKEFPINVFRCLGGKFVYSGGGYFRLFPYRLIAKAMKRSKYVMTYFHPRDFDPEQPILKGLTLMRRIKSYYGLSSSFQKLNNLLIEFDFMDIAQADSIINWDKVDVIPINS